MILKNQSRHKTLVQKGVNIDQIISPPHQSIWLGYQTLTLMGRVQSPDAELFTFSNPDILFQGLHYQYSLHPFKPQNDRLSKFQQIIFNIISLMQSTHKNEAFVFEDDPETEQRQHAFQQHIADKIFTTQPLILQQESQNQPVQHELIQSAISPNFHTMPSTNKKQPQTSSIPTKLLQEQPEQPNFLFHEQNAYSFRNENLQIQKKISNGQSSIAIIGQIQSQKSKEQTLFANQQNNESQESNKKVGKTRRNHSMSKFKNINDQSSVLPNKLGQKLDHFQQSKKLKPNFLADENRENKNKVQFNKTQNEQNHKTQDNLSLGKKGKQQNLEEKINQKKLPPIESKRPGQIIINTSNIIQSDSSMIIMNKKDSNRINIPNESITNLTFNEPELSKMAFKIIPRNKLFKGIFKRQKKCFSNYYCPQYSILSKDMSFIVNGQKQFGNINSYYNISAQQRVYDYQDQDYMGYIKGNFQGTYFNIFQKKDNLQQMVGTVFYQSELTCSPSFRKIQVYIKNENYTYSQLQGSSDSIFQKDLKYLYSVGENATQKKIVKLISKQPVWNQQIGCFIMNFKGKSKLSSVKNMILIEQNEPNRFALLVCKTEQNSFHLELSYPLSPFISMGILLSSFDFKLCCQ